MVAVLRFHAKIVSADRVWFDGMARSVTFPGERGTFEVLPFHRPLISRLAAGEVVVDGRTLPIRRGVVRVWHDDITAIVEPSSR